MVPRSYEIVRYTLKIHKLSRPWVLCLSSKASSKVVKMTKWSRGIQNATNSKQNVGDTINFLEKADDSANLQQCGRATT